MTLYMSSESGTTTAVGPLEFLHALMRHGGFNRLAPAQ
jgi:hypothetical protein